VLNILRARTWGLGQLSKVITIVLRCKTSTMCSWSTLLRQTRDIAHVNMLKMVSTHRKDMSTCSRWWSFSASRWRWCSFVTSKNTLKRSYEKNDAERRRLESSYETVLCAIMKLCSLLLWSLCMNLWLFCMKLCWNSILLCLFYLTLFRCYSVLLGAILFRFKFDSVLLGDVLFHLGS
jgi:hypothetical protein